MKFLISAINGIGLGHVTRQLAVARELRTKFPDAKFLFLTTAEASGIIWQDGFASLKIPSWISLDRGMLDQDDWVNLNTSVVKATVTNFRPDIYIADSFPAGEVGELSFAVETIQRKILVMDQYPGLLSQPSYQESVSNFDLILLLFEEGDIQLPFTPKAPVKWIGPIAYRSRDEALPRDEARRRLGLSEDQLCFYVSLGGGGSPEHDKVLEWISGVVKSFPEIQFFHTIPPLARDSNSILRADNARSICHFPFPFLLFFNAFDAAIAGTGITSVELVQFGVPSVWIPMGSSEAGDQIWRAQWLVDSGLGWTTNSFDTDGLISALRALSSPDARAAVRERMLAQPEPRGAKNAAEAIAAWLRE